jgi:hypothetical protein
MFDLKDLTAEHFQPLVGSDIVIDSTDQTLTIEAVDLIKSPSPRGQPFSITLRAPAGKSGPQGIYHLVHPDLGVLPVFLVPLEPKNGSIRFEAVFN